MNSVLAFLTGIMVGGTIGFLLAAVFKAGGEQDGQS